MKAFRWLVLFAVLALALSVGVAAVSAAGTGPVGAPYVDNTFHVLTANSDTWYRFEYDGTHSQITVRLVDAQDSGLAFEVYPPAQMQEWWKYEGIGMGSAHEQDLLWTGNSHEGGTWYVRVINSTFITKPFQLIVSGEDVSFANPPIAQVPASSPVIASVENNVPDKALVVDASTKVIPANTTLWYRFAYDGTRDQVTIKIPKGAEHNLRMEILAPSQLMKWWESATKPIGQGTPHQDDLIWSGNSNEAGLWYVKVVNTTAAPVGFTFQFEYLENPRQPH